MRCFQGRVPRILLAGAIALAVGGTAVAEQRRDARRQQQQQQQQQDKLDEAQRQQVQALVRLADQAMAGQEVPTDFTLEWHNDFLKALEGKTYVPFTIVMDKDAVGPAVAMYLRVVDADAASTEPAPPAADQARRGGQEAADPPPSTYAFEDVHFIDVKLKSGEERPRLQRAFAVPAGDYVVYVALRDRTPVAADAGQEPRATVLRQPVTVPDFWTDELTTSSVILAESVEQLAAPLAPEEQNVRPYTLGATEISPALDPTFSKDDLLSIIFLIYNPQLDGTNKPDVEVEYDFYRRTEEGEKYFNKTNPQVFNAETLPPQFDIKAGHQLVAGQELGLAPFPAGEYRLEITVNDRHSGRSLQRNVSFTVVES
jgi:hypothetical protein